MNDIDAARAELRRLGITPNQQLIENWLRAERAEQAQMEQPGRADRRLSASGQLEWQPEAGPTAARQTPSSKSRLEPILREQGTLERPSGRRKPGRPRIVASWFPKVAETMADGTSLKMALAIDGISLRKSEVRACYRNRTLQALYQEARRKFLAETYGRRPTLRAVIGRYL